MVHLFNTVTPVFLVATDACRDTINKCSGTIQWDLHIAHCRQGLVRGHLHRHELSLLLRLNKELAHPLLRLEEMLLLHDDGVHNTIDGRASKLLGDLCQLLATLLPHHLAAAPFQDPRSEK